MDLDPRGPSERAVQILQVACPIAIAVLFAALLVLRLLTLVKSKRASYSVGATRRKRLLWLSPALCVTFVSARQPSWHEAGGAADDVVVIGH